MDSSSRPELSRLRYACDESEHGRHVARATRRRRRPYLVQVVLLLDLSLDLAVDGQAQEIGILLPRDGGGIDVAVAEHVLQVVDGPPGAVHLLVDRILEVAGQALDLLDLQVEVAPQAGEGLDDVLLDLAGLVGLEDGRLVVVAQDAQGVVQTAGGQEAGRRRRVVEDVGELDERLGLVLVVGLDFPEVGNEVLEQLPPGWTGGAVSAVRRETGTGRGRAALPWKRLARASVGLPWVGTGQ